MKDSFGTNLVTGLNVAQGPHLIEDSQLRESFNGWTDEDGVWRPAQAPVPLYERYTAISCMAAGRMKGADHQVWMDGNTLYDNGVNVGTITAGTTMDITALDDSFLIFGAAKNYIWDGDHLREQGAWQPDYVYFSSEYGASTTTKSITGITQATNAVVTIGAHDYVAGDMIVIKGIVTGPTEMNDKAFAIVSAGATTVTVEYDTTALTAWSASGTVRLASRIPGTYKFYTTTCVRMSNGRVLESRPRGILASADRYKPILYYDRGPDDTWDATSITLADDYFMFFGIGGTPAKFYFTRGASALFSITGSYDRGVRIYRTKSGGTDFYLERELWSGDAQVSSFTDGSGTGIEITRLSLGKPDAELGAVYTPLQYDNNSALAASTGDVSAQRCLLNSTAYPDRVYWSSLDGIEYFNQNIGWDKRPDTVTGIIGFRDGWCVFSSDRLWFMRIIDGLPDWTEIPTPVGTIWPKAMWTFDGGVAWLRDDGLWFWDGSGPPDKVSWRAFSEITDPQSVTGAGAVLYVSGSERAYVAIKRPQGWVWHECDGSYPMASGTNGSVYAASVYGVYKLFAGQRAGGRIRSKHFGNMLQSKSVRVNLDFIGDTIPALWINGNRQSDLDGHSEVSRVTESGRRIERISVPRLNNQFVELQFDTTGDVRLYGYEVEAAR